MNISEISKITQVPASTIRSYEHFRFIEPAERLSNGYRVFNNRHILQIKLCRLIFRTIISKDIRKFSFQIIEAAAKWDIPLCKRNVEEYISLIEDKIQKAYDMFDIIQNWQISTSGKAPTTLYNLTMTARAVGTTKDTIRNWERNGLLNRHFGKYQKRLYTENDITRLKIIYMLRQTGYTIAALLSFFTAVDEGDPLSLQILIDPKNDENLFNVCDRWLQTVLAAKSSGMDMLVIIKDFE